MTKSWIDDDVTGIEPDDPKKLREAPEFMSRMTGATELSGRTPAATYYGIEQIEAERGREQAQEEWAKQYGFLPDTVWIAPAPITQWSNLHDSSCVGRVCLNPAHMPNGAAAIDIEVKPEIKLIEAERKD